MTVNGTTYGYTMPASFDGYGLYFKAGNYDQSMGSSSVVGATVKQYARKISHS